VRLGREPRTVSAAAAIKGAAAAVALLEDVGEATVAPRRKNVTRRGGAQDAPPRRESCACSRGHRRAHRARGGARRARKVSREARRWGAPVHRRPLCGTCAAHARRERERGAGG